MSHFVIENIISYFFIHCVNQPSNQTINYHMLLSNDGLHAAGIILPWKGLLHYIAPLYAAIKHCEECRSFIIIRHSVIPNATLVCLKCTTLLLRYNVRYKNNNVIKISLRRPKVMRFQTILR